MAFQSRADYQNQAIEWLRKGCSSLGGATMVRFSRIWMSIWEMSVNAIVGLLNAIVGLSELREYLELREHLTLIAPKNIVSN